LTQRAACEAKFLSYVLYRALSAGNSEGRDRARGVAKASRLFSTLTMPVQLTVSRTMWSISRCEFCNRT